MVAFPETDLHRIRLWARGRVPEHLWDELKVEADDPSTSQSHTDSPNPTTPRDSYRHMSTTWIFFVAGSVT